MPDFVVAKSNGRVVHAIEFYPRSKKLIQTLGQEIDRVALNGGLAGLSLRNLAVLYESGKLKEMADAEKRVHEKNPESSI